MKPDALVFLFFRSGVMVSAQMLHDSTKADIDHILQQATQAASVQDELALLRTALRAYTQGMTAQDAVAWAAKELSKSITHDYR